MSSPSETQPAFNAREERFCRAYAYCPNATAAALEAGYAKRSAYNQGWRLLRRPEVRRRIVEIRGDVVQRTVGGRVTLIAKVEGLYQRAIAAGDYAVALRILESQERMIGLRGRERECRTWPVLDVSEEKALADAADFEDAWTSMFGYSFTRSPAVDVRTGNPAPSPAPAAPTGDMMKDDEK